jgi:hypothetical protein
MLMVQLEISFLHFNVKESHCLSFIVSRKGEGRLTTFLVCPKWFQFFGLFSYNGLPSRFSACYNLIWALQVSWESCEKTFRLQKFEIGKLILTIFITANRWGSIHPPETIGCLAQARRRRGRGISSFWTQQRMHSFVACLLLSSARLTRWWSMFRGIWAPFLKNEVREVLRAERARQRSSEWTSESEPAGLFFFWIMQSTQERTQSAANQQLKTYYVLLVFMPDRSPSNGLTFWCNDGVGARNPTCCCCSLGWAQAWFQCTYIQHFHIILKNYALVKENKKKDLLFY